MSTANDAKGAASALVADSKALLEQAMIEEDQLDLLEPLAPEELAEARSELGANAGGLSVVRRARERRKGRPPGARNRRTDDFQRYIMQFGQDPAITMMQIQSTPAEVLIERSRRMVKKIGEGGEIIEVEQIMTYEAAESLRIRCAEALLPYIHSKKPVAIDATILGVHIHEEIHTDQTPRGVTIDAEPVGVLPLNGKGRHNAESRDLSG